MTRKAEIFSLCIVWFAIIAQFVLLLQNRQASFPETIIRFFSYFTILTNLLVAGYLTGAVFNMKGIPFGWLRTNGAFTAITAFIVLVGTVYQVALRHLWAPQGLQWLVDELLHTVIPLFMLLYWWVNVEKQDLLWNRIFRWLWYPVIYIAFVLTRGYFVNFYPYPFLNVAEIGWTQTIISLIVLLLFILLLLTGFYYAGLRITRNRK